MRNSIMTDLLIIGSGAAGLTAAIYARRAGLDVRIAEKEYLGTGQIAQTMRVDNYPGLPGISGYDLGEAFRAHAESLGAEFLEGEVQSLHRSNAGWTCILDTKGPIEAKAVIAASGCRYRSLHIPGEEELLGKRIHFCALCDGAFYEGKTVAVIGGSQMAATDALYLCTVAEKVLILYRGSALKAAQAEINALEKCENVEIIYKAAPTAFLTEPQIADINPACGSDVCSASSALPGQVIIRTADGRFIAADGVFEAVGMAPETGYLWDILPLAPGGFVPADETCATSLPGLFAAGDIRSKPLRQVITACADGANAAMSAEQYIRSLK